MFSKRLNKWKFQCPLNLLIKCNFGQLNSLLVAHSDCQPTLGTSLVVQCLLPLQRGMGLIPGQGPEILHDFTVWPKVSKIKWNGETKKKKKERKPTLLFLFKLLGRVFGESDFTTFPQKHLMLRFAHCVPGRTQQGGSAGSNFGCCVHGRDVEETQKSEFTLQLLLY